MRHLFLLAVLAAVGFLAYKLYVSGEFGQKHPSSGPAAASRQPADASRQPAEPASAGAPANPEQPKNASPGDVIGGVLSSGKKVGRGASKAFGSVDFGGK
jgi:hypothetical protein